MNNTKNLLIRFATLFLLFFLPLSVFSIDIKMGNGAKFNIVSRTSFGIDLKDVNNFGLLNELTQFDLLINLLPYQEISNMPNSAAAIGFISLSLQEFNLIRYKSYLPRAPEAGNPNDNPILGWHGAANARTDSFQPGEFLTGISKGNWLIQLNAGGNEPFTAPWFKGMQYINDAFKFSWAYLDSVVDIRRINAISKMPIISMRGEELIDPPGQGIDNDTVRQYSFQYLGNIADRFGANISNKDGGGLIGVMYNTDDFGLNLKVGTRFPFDVSRRNNELKNGLALGLDSVFTPFSVPGLKIFASVMGTINYYDGFGTNGKPRHNSEPIMGGTRIGYNIPLTNVISIEPFAGIDIGTKINAKRDDFEKPEYEVSFGATMRWPGDSGWQTDYILNTGGRVYPGLSIGYKIYENTEKKGKPEHSIRFSLFEPRGDTQGLFLNVGSEMAIDIIDLTNTTFGVTHTDPFYNPPGGFSILGTAYFDYQIKTIEKLPGMLVPWTILYYDNLSGNTKKAKRINDFKVDLGLNLEGAISNTIFGLVWNSGSLIQNEDPGFIRFLVEIKL